MQITTTTDIVHWRESQEAVMRRLNKVQPVGKTALYWLISILLWIAIAIAVIAVVDKFDWGSAGVAALIFFSAFVDYLYAQYRRGRAIRPFPQGMAVGEHHFDFNADGIDVTGPFHRLHVGWELVTGYLDTRQALCILLEDINGLVLRREDIADIDALKRLLDEHSAIVVPQMAQATPSR